MHSSKVASPTKPKQWNRQSEAAHTGWGYLLLWCDIAVFVKVARLPPVFPVEIWWDGDAAGWDENSHEREAAFPWVEAVDFFEYNRKGFEEDVEDSVDQGDVEIEEEDNRLEKAELEGANEGFKYDIL